MVLWNYRITNCAKILWAVAMYVGVSGCSRAMHDDGRRRPLESSTFFAYEQSARTPVPGTVSRESFPNNDEFHSGKSNQTFVTALPIKLSRETFENGRQKYETFCSPCHDRAGTGHGIVVQRGFKQPVSFSESRLRNAPAGYFFDVISRGYKTMLPMASQISPQERWEIVAYLRALQLSQHAELALLPEPDRMWLTSEK